MILLLPQDEAIHNSIFAAKRGGYNPSLNHYRAIYRNLNLADENGKAPALCSKLVGDANPDNLWLQPSPNPPLI